MKKSRKLKTFLAFLDLSSAFDKVWRDGLFYLLWKKGIQGKCWKILRALYKNVSNKVLYGNYESEWFEQEFGLKQGCVLSIAGHRLFKPVRIGKDEKEKRSFLQLSFANKGLDGVNLGNILHHKLVQSQIPPYFRDQSVPIISYTYTKPIATKIFNYKHVLQDLNIDDFKSKPPDCTCASSQFTYNPAGHVITGDLNIVDNTSLRNLLSKGPKYREPKSINWKSTSKY